MRFSKGWGIKMAMYAGDNTPTAATLYGSLGYSPYNQRTRPPNMYQQPNQPSGGMVTPGTTPGQATTGQGFNEAQPKGTIQPQAPGTGPQIASPPPGTQPGQATTGQGMNEAQPSGPAQKTATG